MSALTKILIVLSTVFSIILSVVMVLMVSKQENYKQQVDSANTGRLAAVASLVKATEDGSLANTRASDAESRLATAATDLQAERSKHEADNAQAESQRLALESQAAQMRNDVATATAANKTLADANAEKDKRLADLIPQVTKLNQQNADLYKSNQEKENQLRAAELAVRKLQEAQVANNNGAAAAGGLPGGTDNQVQSLSSAPVARAPINAKITNIAQSAGRTLLDLPLGTRDGVQVNTKLMIYRNSGYVGEAVVQRVTADESVAVVTSTKQGETVQNNDMVSTNQ